MFCAAVCSPGPAGLGAQSRTFASEPDYILGLDRSRSASLTLADIDGDGDLDILVANGRHWPQQNLAFLNHGAPRDAEHVPPGEGYGRFMEAFPVGPEMTTSYAIPAGDLDGDGDPDLVVANDRAPNQVYRNVGGRFQLAGYLGPAPDLSRDAHLGDFDGDGDLDVAVANRREGNVVYLNDGRGAFGEPRGFGTGDDSTIKLSSGDLDGDGDLDLVLANRDGQPNAAYLNDGRAGFVTARPFGTGSDETLATAVADLDGDGHLDIVAVNAGQPDVVYFGDGRGGFARSTAIGGEDDASFSVSIADLDLDGDPDIVVGNAGGRNAVYFNAGDGATYRDLRFGAEDDVTYWLVTGDVDGDGFPDIAVANSDGANQVFLNRSAPARRERVRTAGRVGLLAFLGAVAAPPPALGQTVVVLMFDGWSPAMIEVEPTPALDAMRREGAWTHALEPAFPTISLPNQISLSTGCWPQRHGIVSNLFIDPERGEYDHATEPDWLLACEHLHQVAERQGVRSAALWWIGARSAGGDPLATYVADPAEDPASPDDAERGRRVVELLRLPVSERPRLVLAYFTEPDMTAHYEGIGSPLTRARIRESDVVVGAVLDELRRLRAAGEPVTLFVTTDHGMLEVQAIVNVERILRRHDVRARFTSTGTTSFLYFESEEERDRALAALAGYSQFDVYRRDALPPEWRLGTSRRIGDLTLSAHPPFFIENIGEWPWWARWLGRWGPEFIKARTVLKATHGYPANVPGMRGFLYAWGDGIARGWIEGLRAVDLHPAVAALLGVEPGSPVDGAAPPSLVVRRPTPEP